MKKQSLLRVVSFITGIGVVICFVCADVESQPASLNTPHEAVGVPLYGLQPVITVDGDFQNRGIEIEFIGQTNFHDDEWLKTPNRFGSSLRLWLADGKEVQATDRTAAVSSKLPPQSTVSNIMREVPRTRHPGMWLSFGPLRSTNDVGRRVPSANFLLKYAFDLKFTNDMVLQITPMLYRVDEKIEKASLVEFPPIKMKLLSNGDVQKIEDPIPPQ